MCWLQASNSFTYGLALPRMAGNKILLTGRHGTHYQLSVESANLWSHILANNKCNQLFESGIMAIIKVTRRNVSALSVSDRVGLLSTIARSAGLSDRRFVVLTSAEGILFPRLLSFRRNTHRDFYYFVWIERCRYVNVDKSMEKLKTISHHLSRVIGNVNWFLLPFPGILNSTIKMSRHRRFADPGKRYRITTTLPVLKINAMQIMNFNIPNTVFHDFTYPFDVVVFQVRNNSREILRQDQKSWIRFTQLARNIRFQPTVNDRGTSILHICTNSTMKNESCAVLQIIVTSLSPQVHQIHIREERDDYIINYTLPLVWFRSHKVMKDSQIHINAVKASIPIVWGNYNRLLFLNLSSIEGTVLEIMVDVMVHNQTFVQLELMMPVMSLAKSKGIIYQFRSVIRWLIFPFSSEILLFHFKTMLQEIASEISNLISQVVGSEKVMILPLHIYGDPFNSIYIQKESLEFDWTFSVNFQLPNICILEHDLIMKGLIKMQWKNFMLVNTSVIKSKMNTGCDSISQQRKTSSVQTIPMRSTTRATILQPRPVTYSDWQPLLIPNLRLSVECGKVFQYSLPTAFGGIEKLRILPVILTGPQPDWITSSNDNKQIAGVIARNRCPKKEFHFKLIGTNSGKGISVEMNLTISIISQSHSMEHKFQIELVFINSQPFQISLLTKTMKHVSDYIQSTCRQDINCEFNLILLRFSKKIDGSLHLSLGYMENSTSCPQTTGIFLRSQIIDKSSQKSNYTNVLLSRIFYQYGLGQLIHSNFLLNGICKNENIFPPDLGQKVVFNNIPSFVSLRPFIEFYNHTVSFYIGDQTKNPFLQENYSQWMKLSNDSFTLYILASTEHVRSQPYIVELSVNPGPKHKMLLPRVAIEVRNLMHHRDFHPFIRELNHQISVDVRTNKAVIEADLPLTVTFELCEIIDRCLRADCADASKNDCGTDILVFVNSIIDIQDGCSINYKLSSLRILTDGRSSSFTEISNQKIVCPLRSLNHMESRLKIAFHEYRQTSNANGSWNLELFKVLYMGSCVHTETAYIRVKSIEESTPKVVHFQKENKLYFENTQQIFLMATVIPASSFIFITLILGLATACLLNRRNRKKNSCNSATLKIQKYPPVIFQSENDVYSPPSKPLILLNEKPPQPLPDDEDEDEVTLIPSTNSIKFYRSTI